MKIYSVDKKSWLYLDIFSDDEYDYSSFFLEATVDIGHSYFKGKNTDLHFCGVNKFLSELDAFIMDRSIQPRLNGTYDSYLIFKGTVSHVFVSFYIGSASYGIRSCSYAIQGTFEIDQENLMPIVSDFSKLFACL